jgi:tetratricopeptide (TPR) repeat protein
MRRLGLVLFVLLAAATARLDAQRIKLPMKLGELEKAVQQDSLDPAAHYNVALGYWNEKRYDDAEKELRAALSLDPRLADAHLALAYLPFARQPGLWRDIYDRPIKPEVQTIRDLSDRDARRAYLMDPLVNVAIIGATLPKTSALWIADEGLYDHYYQAFNDLDEGKYESAFFSIDRLVEEWRRDVGTDPDRIPAQFLWYRGLAAAHINRTADAVRDFGQLLNRSQKSEASDTIYHSALKTNDYRYLIAAINDRAGSVNEAIAGYQEVLRNDIGLYMAHVRLANLFEASRRYAEAIAERKNAVNANPDDWTLLTELGVTEGRAGQFQDAETALAQAIAANPRDVRPYFWMGIAEQQLGKTAEAKSAFEHFIAVAPSRYGKQVETARQRLQALQ